MPDPDPLHIALVFVGLGILIWLVIFLTGLCPHATKWYHGHRWGKWQNCEDEEYGFNQERYCEHCQKRQVREC